MKVFYIEHDGHYLGGHSVVVAESEEKANELMKAKLIENSLDPNRNYNITEIDTTVQTAHLLWNGDY